MPAIPCSVPDCQFQTAAGLSSEVGLQIILLHRQDVHGMTPAAPQPPSPSSAKAMRPTRPTVNAGMSESEWSFFLHEWARYTRLTGIKDEVLRDELWSCMEESLRQLAFSEGFVAKTETELISKIKDLAVTTLHPSVHVVALHQMLQQENESIKAFTARVKGTASNCRLIKTCSKVDCDQQVSYLEETCFHVVMSGLIDQNLREKVLTQAMLNTVKDLPTLLNYVTAEESAKTNVATHETSVNAMRRFSGNFERKNRMCGHCGQPIHGKNNKDRISQCKAYGKECSNCAKPNHFASQCKSKKAVAVSGVPSNADTQQTVTSGAVQAPAFVSSLATSPAVTSPATAAATLKDTRNSTSGPITTLPLAHHVYDRQLRAWIAKSPKPAPTLTVSIRLDRAAYGQLKLNPPRLNKRASAGHARGRRATTDTGAQLRKSRH